MAIEIGMKSNEMPSPLTSVGMTMTSKSLPGVVMRASQNCETPTSAKPTTSSSRVSTRPGWPRPARRTSGARSAIIAARQKINSPLSVAVKPSGPCRNCGNIDDRAEQRRADRKAQHRTGQDRTVTEARKSTIGSSVPCSSQLANATKTDRRTGRRRRDDDRIVEPVVALAFVEDVLQRAQASGKQREPDRVDGDAARIGGVAQPREDHDAGEDARARR